MNQKEALFNFDAVYSEHGLPQPDLFQRLTSSLRMSPSLFIIGAQKAGTNSLANYLSSQRGIIPPWHKEISFFNNDTHFENGDSWYKSFFSTNFIRFLRDKKNNVNTITFDASANYFEEIKSANRIKQFNQDAKIIVILRDPVMRAWSHYKMAVAYGFEEKTFNDALKLETERITQNTRRHNFAFQRLGYRSKGEYVTYLKHWMNLFGNNILVLFYEDIFANKITELQKIHDFIGLKNKAEPEKLIHLNKGKADLINPDDLKNLKQHYAPFNQDLSELLNRSLPWQNNQS